MYTHMHSSTVHTHVQHMVLSLVYSTLYSQLIARELSTFMLFMCKQGTWTHIHTHMHLVHTADSSSLYILIVLSVSAHSSLHPLLSKQQANIPASLSSDPGWTVVCNFWKQYPLFQSQKYIEPLSAVKEEKKQIILHDSHHVENFEVIRLYVLK